MTDKDNKHFEQYMAGSSDLSKAYKKMPELNSPEYLDERILKAARKSSVKKRHAFSPFASNWAIPVSLAAVLLITVILVPVLEKDYIQPASETEAKLLQDIAETRGNIGKTGMPVDKKDSTPAPVMAYTKSKKRNDLKLREEQLKSKSAELPKESAIQTGALPESADNVRMLEKSARKKNPVIADARRDSHPRLKMEAGKPSEEKKIMSQMSGAATSITGISDKSPEDWLKKIKVLLDEKKEAEAMKSLKLFHEQYPDYPAYRILGDKYKSYGRIKE